MGVNKKNKKGKKVAAAPLAEEARGQACVQPTFREEAKVFWHWTGYPAKEGSYTLRQMAQVHPSSEAEGCPSDQAEDPTPNQPVHSDPRQADSHQPVQAFRQV